MKRVQEQQIFNDLAKKMVIIVGPRQAGKTHLAETIAKRFEKHLYLNYDSLQDRKLINQQTWLPSTDLLILDELHKMPEWKNYLKGVYDTKPNNQCILVTGSARLDIFTQLGDALAGRYFLHHLFPLSPAELYQLNYPFDFEKLMTSSGFPEPFLESNMVDVKRWRMQYVTSIITSDVFEFDNVKNIKSLKLVFELLRTKVGSPVSYSSLSEDAQVSPATVKKYIQIFEALYIVFRITPYSKNIARSLLKEPKLYFYDTGLVKGKQGAKFENLVANCLLKHMYAKIDYQAEEYKLHYLRTKEGIEVDFALVNEDSIEQIIEVKSSNSDLHKGLVHFSQKYELPAVQLVQDIRHEYVKNNIQVLKAVNYLKQLDL